MNTLKIYFMRLNKNILIISILSLFLLNNINAQLVKNDGVMIFNTPPTTTQCNYCSEIAFSRIDSSFYFYSRVSNLWKKIESGGGIDTLFLRNDSIYVYSKTDTFSIFLDYVDNSLFNDSISAHNIRINDKVGGSGVAGQVSFWSGTKTLSGSNNLFWDDTNERLGIGGITSPSSTLHLQGGGTGAMISFANGGGVIGNIGAYGGDGSTISVNRDLGGVRNFNIYDGTGNLIMQAVGSTARVGYGAPPLKRLHSHSNTEAQLRLSFAASSEYADFLVGSNSDLTLNFRGTNRVFWTNNGFMGLNVLPTFYSLDINETGALRAPRGTTAQRPVNAAGVLRYNSDCACFEWGNGTTWNSFLSGSGTSGQVAFWNATNTQTGSANLVWDNSINRLTTTGSQVISSVLVASVGRGALGAYDNDGVYVGTNSSGISGRLRILAGTGGSGSIDLYANGIYSGSLYAEVGRVAFNASGRPFEATVDGTTIFRAASTGASVFGNFNLGPSSSDLITMQKLIDGNEKILRIDNPGAVGGFASGLVFRGGANGVLANVNTFRIYAASSTLPGSTYFGDVTDAGAQAANPTTNVGILNKITTTTAYDAALVVNPNAVIGQYTLANSKQFGITINGLNNSTFAPFSQSATYGIFIGFQYQPLTNGYGSSMVLSGKNDSGVGVEVMRLQGKDGNVGIGLTNALYTLDVAGTGGIRIPQGTTAQRPTGAAGVMRYNSDCACFEFHNGTAWSNSISGTLTSGQVAFATGAGTLGGSANLFWDSANGRLRIGGSTSPLGIVYIEGSGSGVPLLSLNNAVTSTALDIFVGDNSQVAAGYVAFRLNGFNVMTLKGNNAVSFSSNTWDVTNNVNTILLRGGYGGATLGTSIRLQSNSHNGGIYTATTGTQNTLAMGNGSNESWSPSSGTATYNLVNLNPIVNTTGTYTGTIRALYINPTLTSVTGASFRAVETTNNSGYGIYQAGSSAKNYFQGYIGNGTDNPTYRYHQPTGGALFNLTGNEGFTIQNINPNNFFRLIGANSETAAFTPASTNFFATGVDGSAWTFGNVKAALALNLSDWTQVNNWPITTLPANTFTIYSAGGLSLGQQNKIPMIHIGSATPYSNVTIIGGYSTGTNISHTNPLYPFRIIGPLGTGTGLSGDIILSVGESGISGTDFHNVVNKWWIKGQTGNLGTQSTVGYTLDMNSRTDGIRVPIGTTAQRPTGAAGVMRYNSDCACFEFHNGTAWSNSISGTLTSGQVAFATGAGTLGGSNNLFWDSANERLGVGTNAPVGTFHLRGAATFQPSQSQTNNPGNLVIRMVSADNAGQNSMEIAGGNPTFWPGGSGLVFTNHTRSITSNSAFHVAANFSAGAGVFGAAFGTPANNLMTTADINGAYVTALKYASPAPYPSMFISGPNIYMNTKTSAAWPDGSAGLAYGTTRLSILANGNVGIGTATPLYLFTATSTNNTAIAFDGGSNPMFGLGSAADPFAFLSFRAISGLNRINTTNRDLQFQSNSITSVLYIESDATGNIGIGDVPSYRLDIGTSTNAVRFPIGTTAQRPTGAAGVMRYNSDCSCFEFHNGTAWSNSISGTLTNGQVAFATGAGTLGGSNNLFWDSANNRFSIGGIQTTYNLAVVGSFKSGSSSVIGQAGTGAQSLLVTGSTGNSAIPVLTATNEGGTELFGVYLLYNNLGSVGRISTQLEVGSKIRIEGQTFYIRTDQVTPADSKLTVKAGDAIYQNRGGGDLWIQSGAGAGSGAGGAISFFTSLGIAASGVTNTQVQRMTILPNGYVGIGTATPAAALDFNLASTITSGTTPSVHLRGGYTMANTLTAFSSPIYFSISPTITSDLSTLRPVAAAIVPTWSGTTNARNALYISNSGVAAQTAGINNSIHIRNNTANENAIYVHQGGQSGTRALWIDQTAQNIVIDNIVSNGWGVRMNQVGSTAYNPIIAFQSSSSDALPIQLTGRNTTSGNSGIYKALDIQNTSTAATGVAAGAGAGVGIDFSIANPSAANRTATIWASAPNQTTLPNVVNFNFSTVNNSSTSSTTLTLGGENSFVGINNTAPSYVFDITSTNAIRFPIGTTAQRPTGAAGVMRYNSDLASFELYNTTWRTVTTDTYGSLVTDTTDGSGQITVTLPVTMVDATYAVIANSETTPYVFTVGSKTTSTFVVTVWSGGSTVNSTSVTFNYIAKDY